MDIAFYYNSPVSRWHIDQCQLQGQKYENLDDFITAQYANKIAIMHTPAFTDLTPFEHTVQELKIHCDRIILLTSELHNDTVALLEKLQDKKIINFVCGSLSNVQHYHWMDWFITSTRFYQTSDVLDRLTPWQTKPKIFDILLGQPKQHRTLIYDFAKDFQDKVIMTYFKNHYTAIREYDEQQWIWESEGLEIPAHDFNFTVTPVRYYGQQISLSQIVPINIYNQTAYSIICETNFENHYSFFTEKTVKPILGKRLFLLFGGQYQLRNLRNLGFKTFDGIIDESYDSEASIVKRAQLIQEQMRYLLNQEQSIILDQIKPIVEHNYSLMLETDWYDNFARELRAVVLDHKVQN